MQAGLLMAGSVLGDSIQYASGCLRACASARESKPKPGGGLPPGHRKSKLWERRLTFRNMASGRKLTGGVSEARSRLRAVDHAHAPLGHGDTEVFAVPGKLFTR